MNKKSIFFTIAGTIIVIFALAGVFMFMQNSSSQGNSEELEALATCLTDSGATFYGAFWCPHCQNQKKAFGSASELLPYVECSTPDGKGQTEVCVEAGITGYPTWVFGDGTQASGEYTLAALAEYTGCPAPAVVSEE